MGVAGASDLADELGFAAESDMTASLGLVQVVWCVGLLWLAALLAGGRINCSVSNTRLRDMIRIGRNLII